MVIGTSLPCPLSLLESLLICEFCSCGLFLVLVQLLHKLSIHAADGPVKLLKVCVASLLVKLCMLYFEVFY